MPFSESIKREVKKNAHYKCCLCRKYWVADVHHITPEAEGGPNTEDNAAPLCANCHDLYGGNPDKRKFIKESRDFWYDLCEKSSLPNLEMIREMHEHLRKEVVTKKDLDKALKPLFNIMQQKVSPEEKRQAISDVSSAISTSAISDAIAISDADIVYITGNCPKCNTPYSIDTNVCPNCGWSRPYVY